jgi:hypothetical protein
MNNPELTKWLLKVRNALAESDEVKMAGMAIGQEQAPRLAAILPAPLSDGPSA